MHKLITKILYFILFNFFTDFLKNHSYILCILIKFYCNMYPVLEFDTIIHMNNANMKTSYTYVSNMAIDPYVAQSLLL